MNTTPIEISEADSQIIYLAKNHFKVDKNKRRMEDLKILVGHRNAIEVQYVTDYGIFVALTDLMLDCNLQYRITTLHGLAEIVMGSRYGYEIMEDKRSGIERFIDFVMSELSVLQIRERKEEYGESIFIDIIKLAPLNSELVAAVQKSHEQS